MASASEGHCRLSSQTNPDGRGGEGGRGGEEFEVESMLKEGKNEGREERKRDKGSLNKNTVLYWYKYFSED
jgi:hypothetical protein